MEGRRQVGVVGEWGGGRGGWGWGKGEGGGMYYVWCVVSGVVSCYVLPVVGNYLWNEELCLLCYVLSVGLQEGQGEKGKMYGEATHTC